MRSFAVLGFLVASSTSAIAFQSIEMTSLQFSASGFGTVGIVSANFKNKFPFPIKDISLDCRFYAESNTELHKTTVVVYRIFSPGKTVSVRNINVGFLPQQVRQGSCLVTDYQHM